MSSRRDSSAPLSLCPLLPGGFLPGQECEVIDRYHMVAEQSRTVFWEVDPKGLFTRVSHVAAAVWGYAPTEIVGRMHFYDLHPEQGREGFKAAALGVFARHERFRDLLNPVQRKDGSTVWMSTTGVPFFDANGGLQGYRGSDTDVTERHLAEEALRRERRRLANVIEGTNAAIWEWNVQSGEVIFNERWAEIVGYTLEELAPLSIDVWLRLGHPDDMSISSRLLEEHFTGKNPYYDCECRMRHKDGRWVWVHDRGRVTDWDAAGKPLWMAGTHTDITKRKQSELELQDNRALLQAAIDESALAQERLWLHMQGTTLAYVELDMAGTVTYWNPAAESLFGYSRDEMMGKPIDSILYRSAARSAFQVLLPSLHKTLATRVSVEHVTKDDRVLTCEWSTTLLVNSDGTDIGVACLGRDVTELRALMGRLRQAKEKAEAAAKAKSEFLSMMSHEIRTPMNGIIGLSSLLLDSRLDGEPRNYAQGIRTSADALLSVINDILDFSKVDAGKMDIECVPFDLQTAMEDVLELVALNAEEKNLELALRFPAQVPRQYQGDVGRIRQVVLNLVNNAIKFTHRGMVLVEVGADPGRAGKDQVAIAVHDTGVGIPRDKFPLLFSQFTQLDSSSTRRYGGSGLGLAISRRLAMLMGGDIHVVSDDGEGSTFTLRLPLEQVPAPVSCDAARLAGFRVLLADQHETSRFLNVERCSGWGMEVLEARSAAEAVEVLHRARLQGTPPHALIIDHALPGLDSTVIRQLHSAMPAHPPSILLVAHNAHRLLQAEPIPFTATLTKPVRSEALAETIARILALPLPKVQTQSPDQRPYLGTRVLVVEDNAINQRVAAALLRKLGIQVDLAGNGREGLDMVARFPFDLVLMDCQMPEMDGFEATRQIRLLPAPASRVPIVAITAGAMEADRTKCMQAGMTDYLAKPILPEDLHRMLERWVGNRALI
ncbi:MAG: PAS domain S-box protein [Bryobacteraceae bacterium]